MSFCIPFIDAESYVLQCSLKTQRKDLPRSFALLCFELLISAQQDIPLPLYLCSLTPRSLADIACVKARTKLILSALVDPSPNHLSFRRLTLVKLAIFQKLNFLPL